jgi:hypothetical protein
MEHGDSDAQTGGVVLLSLSNFCREDATFARRIDKMDVTDFDAMMPVQAILWIQPK